MANVKFLIRDTDSDNEQNHIHNFLLAEMKKLMYATPLKIEPLFWDEKKECVKNSKYCVNKDEINAALKSIEAENNHFHCGINDKGRACY